MQRVLDRVDKEATRMWEADHREAPEPKQVKVKYRGIGQNDT